MAPVATAAKHPAPEKFDFTTAAKAFATRERTGGWDNILRLSQYIGDSHPELQR